MKTSERNIIDDSQITQDCYMHIVKPGLFKKSLRVLLSQLNIGRVKTCRFEINETNVVHLDRDGYGILVLEEIAGKIIKIISEPIITCNEIPFYENSQGNKMNLYHAWGGQDYACDAAQLRFGNVFGSGTQKNFGLMLTTYNAHADHIGESIYKGGIDEEVSEGTEITYKAGSIYLLSDITSDPAPLEGLPTPAAGAKAWIEFDYIIL